MIEDVKVNSVNSDLSNKKDCHRSEKGTNVMLLTLTGKYVETFVIIVEKCVPLIFL